MSKIPCKKCPNCGFFHDISVVTCSECGKDLTAAIPSIVDTDSIPAEVFGDIDETIIIYSQKCSACGAMNFTADKDRPVRVCYNCHKARVASIVPIEFNAEEPTPTDETQSHDDQAKTTSTIVPERTKIKLPLVKGGSNDDSDDDDDDDGDASGPWQGILGNIRGAVSEKKQKEAFSPQSNNTEKPVELPKEDRRDEDNDDDDDDDDDGTDWSDILGGTSTQKKEKQVEKRSIITLTAIRYGRLSFTVEANKDTPYLLGRSANQKEFLANDGRVGNEHCYILFKNGGWYVKDNHSSNGTAVNSRDIGLNGEHILNDGDELKLGHHSNSMAFRVTILT